MAKPGVRMLGWTESFLDSVKLDQKRLSGGLHSDPLENSV